LGTSGNAPLTDEFCGCGYMGVAVSDGTSMFYFGNNAVMWTPGGALGESWVNIPGYEYGQPFYDGEGSFAVTGGRVYRIGGRENEDRLAYYDIETGAFVTDMLPEHPVDAVASRACAGAVNGKVYVFGWRDGGFTEYDPVTNMWAAVDSDPNGPSYCGDQNVPAWGAYLAYADYAEIKLLNTTLLQWEEEGIPLPDTVNLTRHVTMVVGDQLYVAGFESEDEEIHIYQYMLSGIGSGS
jgi:hypothetical protein